MAMRGLYLPADVAWRSDFEAELMRFPAGTHDDQVDALSLLGQLLDHIQVGVKPKDTDTKPKPTDYRRQNEAAQSAGSWETY